MRSVRRREEDATMETRWPPLTSWPMKAEALRRTLLEPLNAAFGQNHPHLPPLVAWADDGPDKESVTLRTNDSESLANSMRVTLCWRDRRIVLLMPKQEEADEGPGMIPYPYVTLLLLTVAQDALREGRVPLRFAPLYAIMPSRQIAVPVDAPIDTEPQLEQLLPALITLVGTIFRYAYLHAQLVEEFQDNLRAPYRTGLRCALTLAIRLASEQTLIVELKDYNGGGRGLSAEVYCTGNHDYAWQSHCLMMTALSDHKCPFWPDKYDTGRNILIFGFEQYGDCLRLLDAIRLIVRTLNHKNPDAADGAYRRY
jgi:hypothetical protein